MRFDEIIDQLLEDLAPVPPAMVQKAEDTRLSFDEVYNFIKEHEGYRPQVYVDTVGKPTVGIGLNLKRGDAPAIVASAGANYNAILSGKQKLTDEQIRSIFKNTLAIAYADAKKFMPNFDSLPKKLKLAILDLSFNMGYTKLSQFIKFKEALLVKDYNAAARELLNSKWATQVGNRANNIVNLLKIS